MTDTLQDVSEISQTVCQALGSVRDEVLAPPGANAPHHHANQPEDVPTPEILDGLQAVDDQVDQLTNAAGAALGNLWNNIGGAITTGLSAAGAVARSLEQAAHRVASPDGSPAAPYGCAVCNDSCTLRSWDQKSGVGLHHSTCRLTIDSPAHSDALVQAAGLAHVPWMAPSSCKAATMIARWRTGRWWTCWAAPQAQSPHPLSSCSSCTEGPGSQTSSSRSAALQQRRSTACAAACLVRLPSFGMMACVLVLLTGRPRQ
jgi:hypothetical protein